MREPPLSFMRVDILSPREGLSEGGVARIASLSMDSRSQNALSPAKTGINCVPPTPSQFKLISPGKCVREHSKRFSIPGEAWPQKPFSWLPGTCRIKPKTSPYPSLSGPHPPPFSPHSPPATHGVLL